MAIPGPMAMKPPNIDRGNEIIAIFSVQCGLSLLFVVLRLWARISIRGTGLDDVFMVITWILFAALTIIVGFIGHNGGTRHVFYLSQQQALYVTKLNYVAQPFGIVAVGTGKVAVGILVLRLLGALSRWRKIFLWVLLALNVIITIFAAVFTFTQCNPPAALWEPSLRDTAHCWDPSVQSNFSIFSASLNSFTDFVLAFMPITFIWGLHLPTRQRVGLAVLLGVGAFSGVCAAVKARELVSLAARSDLTWETFDLYAWACSEIFLIIVCGSIPTLKPLWIRFFGHPKPSKTSQLEDGSAGTRDTARKYWQLSKDQHPYGQEFSVLNEISDPNKTNTRVTADHSDDIDPLPAHENSNHAHRSTGDERSRAEIQVTRSFQVD
ncbi:hypothetical protein F5B21DRAFT_507499 [Xylaria acuta]|nr:hypothetical protein F5B21DRAFT_507499 [Xylaria acuta]